ncbi:MAG: MFS transporter [Spirochaetes bacterium]|nr:MFS transporter [Spirochaetota bacterium]
MKDSERNTFLVLAVVYLSFFALGLPTGAFAVAWPGVVYEMGILMEQASLILIANIGLYSLTSSQLWRIYKYLYVEKIDLIGAVIMAASMFGLALSPNFTMFVVFSATTGIGSGMIDTSLSAYMAKSFSARHLNWLHGFLGMGSTIGPVIMTQMMVLFSWRMGYHTLAIIMVLSSVVILTSAVKKIWKKEAIAMDKKLADEAALAGGDKKDVAEPAKAAAVAAPAGEKMSKRRYLTKKRHQFMEVLMSFIYGGMEYSIGFWITFVLLESRNMPLELVGIFPAVYYGGLMIGRMIFGYFAEKMQDITMIRLGLGLAFAGTLALMFIHGAFVGIGGIALVGAGFAPIFPCIMHDTGSRFAPRLLTKLVGHEVAANAAGIAVLSAIKGPILAHTSLEALFPIMLGLIALTFFLNEVLERAVNRLGN